MTTDIFGTDLDNVDLYEKKATWPVEKSSHPVRIVEVTEKTFDSRETNAVKGWTKKNVKLEVANGDLAGKPLFMDFFWDPPRDSEGNVVPSTTSVEQHKADGKDSTEAYELAQEGSKKAATIGKQNFLKLMNAAGFIRVKDTKPGDKNMTRVQEGLAVLMQNTENGYEILDSDGNGTGNYFTPDMMVRKIIMAHTAPDTYTKTLPDGSKEERIGRKVNYVSGVSLSEIGDIGEEVPF